MPLQAGLVYRAIDLNMRILRWERALKLAQKHGRWVDAVLLRRAQHLAGLGRPESDALFLRLAGEVEVDPAKIQADLQVHTAAGQGLCLHDMGCTARGEQSK